MRWPFHKPKLAYKTAREPFTLVPASTIKEAQLGAVFAVPLLALLTGLIFFAKRYGITQEDFLLFGVMGFVLWIVSLVGAYSYTIAQANKYTLYDREFGFTERLHPRYEVYCRPEDVSLISGPKQEIEKQDEFANRIMDLGFSATVKEKIIACSQVEKYLYHFRHKSVFQGWDQDKGEIVDFESHTVFIDKPHDQQFVFGAGQENWFGPILYNHNHSESDNVKIIAWDIDPYTQKPMPICQLVHSSTRYRKSEKATDSKDITVLEALGVLTAKQHGIIESLRRKAQNLGILSQEKLNEVDSFIDYGHDIAKADRKLEEGIMKPLPHGWLKSGWAKALVTIAMFATIAFIVAVVLGYIDIGKLWPW